MANLLKRDIEDTIWSVLSSFGFSEEEAQTIPMSFVMNKNEVVLVNKATDLAKAEIVSAVIETIFATGENNFTVTLSDKKIYDLLTLFGFENILKLDKDIKNGFSVISDHTEIAFGSFENDLSIAKINTHMLIKMLESEGAEGSKEVSKSLAFAEKNAEGLCYDVCYNLRVNGCIVEYYTENGDIKDAQEYAEKNGHSCILRCYPNGQLDIKDMAKNEITTTTVTDFLGYCEDDEDDFEEHHHDHCDCGHEHHHDHGECSCGHHHEN